MLLEEVEAEAAAEPASRAVIQLMNKGKEGSEGAFNDEDARLVRELVGPAVDKVTNDTPLVKLLASQSQSPPSTPNPVSC